MNDYTLMDGSESPFFGRSCLNGSKRGFSLVEILVVITIIGLLVTLVATFATGLLDKSRVTTCQNNLKEIATNMLLLKDNRKERGKKSWPQYKGIRFLLELTRHAGNQSGRHAFVSGKAMKMFLCPGTDDINIAPGEDEQGSAYFDLDNLDSLDISYAGRNQIDFPLERDASREDAIMAADDNEGRPNHKFKTNYVTVGPAVDSVDILDFLDDYPDLEYLPVGPDSPYEPFQKLLVDQ